MRCLYRLPSSYRLGPKDLKGYFTFSTAKRIALLMRAIMSLFANVRVHGFT